MTNQNFVKRRFHTVDGDTIMNKQMPPLQYAIAEILPAGLTLFSGDSKVGKSMMALNMCVAVSKGQDFLGFPTTRGTVLYLALEDTESRIQRRVFSMTDTLGDTFHFTNEVYKIGDGLIEALEDFVKEHSDTRLIVIDVLQYIRSQSQGGNVYKEDYNDMIPLHEFTQRHSDIALVLINHTNKSNSGDQFKASSGSTAIVGASDNYWLLQRPVRAFRNGRLYCSGREIADREIALQMNDDGMWVCEDEEIYKGEIISPTVIGTYLYVMWHTNLDQIDKDVCLDCDVVVHKCACGCGEKVVLPLSPEHWKLTYDGEVTLSPSIGNYQYECKSHYFIRNGKVVWVESFKEEFKSKKKRKKKKKSFFKQFKR